MRDFDNAFTAPVHGFLSRDDYYQKASSLAYMKHIQMPTLLLNTLDDPILADACYPEPSEIGNPHLHTAYPKHGGHIGFNRDKINGLDWLDRQALDFLI